MAKTGKSGGPIGIPSKPPAGGKPPGGSTKMSGSKGGKGGCKGR